jgi:ribosome-associated protein YbcJ (S4-like RNA binding protein)
MATIGLGANAATAAAGFTTTPDKYTTIDELLAYNKPDNRELLIKTYGDQGITGFLKLTGAIKNGGQADLIQYWEEQRRHRKVLPGTSTGGSGVETLGTPIVNTSADFLELNTVVMNADDGLVYIVTGLDGSGSTQVLTRLDGVLTSANFTATTELIILGNMYDQGSDQPSTFMKTEPTKRLNSYMIIKDRYEVNGSQATNIGWVNVGGDYRWYVHGEQETRRRFEDRREMMMLFAERTAAAGAAVPSYGGGSEGYFSAVNDRGIIVSNASANPLDSFAEFDSIILELDKQGAPSEYAMYVNRNQSLAIDDMLAAGIATNVTAGLAGQFGAFNNDTDMAVQLGFKSFTRGGYTFHKHDWKLMNDPQLLGASTSYVGAMVPMTQVTDPVSGAKAPALEMNYKESNGYSRELEHWVRGGGVLGHNELTEDILEMNYRSEIALVTRAANQHVIIKG